jgi:hypothetical protein
MRNKILEFMVGKGAGMRVLKGEDITKGRLGLIVYYLQS